MSWKLEVYRALFVAFGMFEIISNLYFLRSDNGIKAAAKQHQEIPTWASEKQLKAKVVLMLSSGIVFFMVGVSSYIIHYVDKMNFLIVLILFALYALGEALYYKYWKTVGFFIVSFMLLLIYLVW